MLRLFAVFFGILFCGQVLAAEPSDCIQKNAIYQDEDKAYTLQFTSPEEGSGIMSNRFQIKPAGTKAALDGWVIWNNGISRPNGIITYKCPGGDITGAELDKCKVWEGVIYTIFPDGAVNLLPPEDDPAAPAFLLPDFGRSLKNSPAWQAAKLQTVPWDVFKFQSCNVQ